MVTHGGLSSTLIGEAFITFCKKNTGREINDIFQGFVIAGMVSGKLLTYAVILTIFLLVCVAQLTRFIITYRLMKENESALEQKMFYCDKNGILERSAAVAMTALPIGRSVCVIR